jgi:hypothetical protein
MDCFVAHWAVEGVTTAYRHFRVHQHGQNSATKTSFAAALSFTAR